MIISLTGFMGCGKSSVGRRLSELLCCRFVDLDSEIEVRCGCTVAEIFEASGEAEFRRIEKETLKDVLETSETRQCATALSPQQYPKDHSEDKLRIVVALGGGAVMTPECKKMVHEDTVCIYLKASVETLLSHLESQAAGRPLLSAGSAVQNDLRERISDLMSRRSSTYERTAHLTIETDGKSVEAIAEEILINLFPSTQGPE